MARPPSEAIQFVALFGPRAMTECFQLKSIRVNSLAVVLYQGSAVVEFILEKRDFRRAGGLTIAMPADFQIVHHVVNGDSCPGDLRTSTAVDNRCRLC